MRRCHRRYSAPRNSRALPEIGEDPLRAVSRLPGVAREDFSSRVHLRGGTRPGNAGALRRPAALRPVPLQGFLRHLQRDRSGDRQRHPRLHRRVSRDLRRSQQRRRRDRAAPAAAQKFQGEAVLSLFTTGVSHGRLLRRRRRRLGARRAAQQPERVFQPDEPVVRRAGLPRSLCARRPPHQRRGSRFPPTSSRSWTRSWPPTPTRRNGPAPNTATTTTGCAWTSARPTDSAGACSVARTELGSDRSGSTDLPGIATGSLVDERDFIINSIQADGWWRPGARSVLQAGAEWRQMSGAYRYADDVDFALLFLTPGAPTTPSRSRSIRVRPSGHQAGAYVNWRFEPAATLTTDLGLRWDSESLAPQDGSHTSPRAVLMWRPRDDTRLRISWGRYFQAQGINELHVSDGEQSYSPSQRATHLVASVEHDLTPQLKLRAEAYRKQYQEPAAPLRTPDEHADRAAGTEAGPHPDRAGFRGSGRRGALAELRRRRRSPAGSASAHRRSTTAWTASGFTGAGTSTIT